MRIGIDISQIVHEGTGVGQYVREIVRALLRIDQVNDYILFGASLRKLSYFTEYFNEVRGLNPRVRLVKVPIPPSLLELLWNRLHTLPVECLTGPVDVFWSSDWIQPPLRRAMGVTTVHDVSFLRFPETFAKTIIDVQKRRLAWVKRECQAIFCDSEATKRDVVDLIGIEEKKLQVVYPGFV
ncbi:glycosyltransferase [Candidatus Gottesmanbacteria bacterium]|nr:glycosyltransferase [Candidatus Gottesmanbacteria bacterium]MBI3559792.1 glycosyltransferase [Candidatus Gottesmanbacteria bacterium]